MKSSSLLLVSVHAALILLAPGLAGLVFLFLSLDPRASAHFGGLLAASFGLLYSYLLFAGKMSLMIILASPIMFVLSRFRYHVVSLLIANALGSSSGWLFGLIMLPGEEHQYVHAACMAGLITGALAASTLEIAWRFTLHPSKSI